MGATARLSRRAGSTAPEPERRAIPSAARGLLGAPLAAGLIVAAVRGGSYAPIPRQELFVLVLWALAAGVALGLLPRYRVPRTVLVALGGLVALALSAGVGLAWSESDERTLAEVARALGFAGVLLIVAWTYGGREWRGAAAWVAAAGVAICVLALVSRLAPDLLPSALSLNSLYRRLGYPLNYWNALASWAAMTLALTLAASAHTGSRLASGAALAGACVTTTVVYLTYSRTGAVAAVLAVAIVTALSRHRWQAVVNAIVVALGTAVVILVIRSEPDIASGRGARGAVMVALAVVVVATACLIAARLGLLHRARSFRLAPRTARTALIAVAAAGIVAAAIAGPSLADRAWSSFSQRAELRGVTDPATRLGNLSGIRRSLWDAALNGFKAHPLRGTGAGTFEFVWNRDPRRDTPIRDAHSLYIEVLGEVGIPGLVALVLALGALVAGSVRGTLAQRDPAAAGLAAGCTAAFCVFCVTAAFDWIWEVTAVAALALACGGLASMAGTGPSARPGIVPRIGATVLVGAWLALQLPVLIGEAQIRASQDAANRDDLMGALSHATTAIDAEPWGARPYLQRAAVLERGGRLAEAAVDARRSARAEPTNWEPWLVLGRIEAERGRIGAALRAARRAQRLNPRSPLFGP